MAPLDANADEGDGRYFGAWSEIGRAMEEGTSWSGHESNVAWLGTRDGRFVDVSIPSGLDHADDGRVALRCDWDGDGDVDVWLRSRSGPTLRYLANQGDPERWIELTASAPGALFRFDIESGDGARTPAIEMRSSDGYLAGTPLTHVVALAPDESAVCPDPTGPLGAGDGVAGAAAIQERDGAVSQARRALEEGPLADAELPTRVVLRTPLPLPAERLQALGAPQGEATLVTIDDPECATCRAVLPGALSALGAALEGPGGASRPVPAVVRLVVGNTEATPSVRMASAVAASVLGPGAELATPLSLLLDGNGRVQVLYVGDLQSDIASRDISSYVLQPVQGALRTTVGAPGAGPRWFHGMPRSYGALVQELVAVGLDSDAAFYSGR
ncbi:MAG: hypothetical protein AAGI22_01625 [Planctomycetota bacterium]